MRYSGRYANRPCWRTASAPSSSELFIGPNHASEYIGERNHQSGPYSWPSTRKSQYGAVTLGSIDCIAWSSISVKTGCVVTNWFPPW